MDELRHYEVEEICAMLTTRACAKTSLPVLESKPDIRRQVKERLRQAGYEFVDDPFSQHYDARIQKEIRNLNSMLEEQLGGDELTVQAKALIAILWCNLVLPLYDASRGSRIREEPLTVSEEQLYENFKSHIGARQNLRKVLTLLRQYDFIRPVWGQSELQAGPRLTTALDCSTMYDRLRNSMIDFLIDENLRQQHQVNEMFEQHMGYMPEREEPRYG